jgi:RimJ/RimL family protein N-acetyltransferase
LETERLILRALTIDDASFILELLNDPSYIHNIGDRNVRTVEGAKTYIKKGPMASYDTNGFGLRLVQLRDTHEPIGICGLIKRDNLDDVDIGYAFLPKFWSKGYATEAALAVTAFARDIIGLKRMVGIVDPENSGSIHVLEKLGMNFEKMIRLSPDDIELKLFSMKL